MICKWIRIFFRVLFSNSLKITFKNLKQQQLNSSTEKKQLNFGSKSLFILKHNTFFVLSLNRVFILFYFYQIVACFLSRLATETQKKYSNEVLKE